LGFRNLGFGVWGVGFGVRGYGLWVMGLGFGVWGLGFRVWGELEVFWEVVQFVLPQVHDSAKRENRGESACQRGIKDLSKRNRGESASGPLSSKCGTCKTVKARFWPNRGRKEESQLFDRCRSIMTIISIQ